MTHHSKALHTSRQLAVFVRNAVEMKEALGTGTSQSRSLQPIGRATAVLQEHDSGTSRAEARATGQEGMARLQKLRSDFQVELARYAQAHRSDAERLVRLRSLADTYADEVDTLIASSGSRMAPEQVGKAEDLRLYFRVARACIATRL